MAQDRPAYDVGQEIRFAVVLYGGVSLAIYMNGVAQELLRLVQATAPKPGSNEARFATKDLHDSARVYRKLGQILSRQGNATSQEKLAETSIRTRFVVDTISGTSAGGINGIFLAKALANDESIDDLQQLWIDEGDIAKLINDEESLEDGLTLQGPTSLLNGDRMYVKLLQAFVGMDDRVKDDPQPRAPLVNDVHLYVTTTDIRGVTVGLQLEDEVVPEQRFKHVFHFIHGRDAEGDTRDDFASRNNAFLAYASRCTSSFPFAFDPMRMKRALQLAPTVKGSGGAGSALVPEDYREFFPDHVRTAPKVDGKVDATKEIETYLMRSFGDGGYLDNKPFGYAIDALSLRADLLPSERRLLYVEPTPEHIQSSNSTSQVDVIENVTAALFSLPTYETIREDLQRVMARNRLVDRIGRLTADLEEDVRAFENAKALSTTEWRSKSLNDLIGRFGVAYGGYHRLKVAAATDDFAKIIATASGFDPDSDECLAIRYLVSEWRKIKYAANPLGPVVRTENEFLLDFGLGYRFRRLGLVRAKIDMLSCLDKRALDTLADSKLPVPSDERASFIDELLRLKQAFGEIFNDLTAGRDRLRNPQRSPLLESLKPLKIGPLQLQPIIRPRTDDERREAARKLLGDEESVEAFHKAAEQASKVFRDIFVESAKRVTRELALEDLTGGTKTAREAIQRYYNEFENYDFITFPVRYSTEIGEIDPVRIVRIGPDDVDKLPKELAGAQFAHFGGFLKKEWRENDILLGRLHGAQRLIATLLPENSQRTLRDQLIEEALEEILKAFAQRRDQAAVTGAVLTAISRRVAQGPRSAGLPSVDKAIVDAAIRQSLEPGRLLNYYRGSGYELDRSLPADKTARTLGRAVRVVGQMLEGLAKEYHRASQPGAWLARLGGAFWELVEIAVPGSLKRLLYEHWAALIAMSGGLMVGVSLVLRVFAAGFYSGRVLAIGAALLVAPSLFMITVWLLADYLYGNGRLRRAGSLAGGVFIAVLAGWKIGELVPRVIEWLRAAQAFLSP